MYKLHKISPDVCASTIKTRSDTFSTISWLHIVPLFWYLKIEVEMSWLTTNETLSGSSEHEPKFVFVLFNERRKLKKIGKIANCWFLKLSHPQSESKSFLTVAVDGAIRIVFARSRRVKVVRHENSSTRFFAKRVSRRSFLYRNFRLIV